MKAVKNLQYFWHNTKSHYYTVIAEDCLDKNLRKQLVEKADSHRLEAIQCRPKTQDLTC
ncbi:hypothetical protein [Sutcliffiella horikoshii]|uniref:hypothetical protein n=1 Tax=Sutcliffiella horikoshii TaxID=79883 RepID=UPI001653D20A|nr:hypothetical protein [Sutcliffiella horikoshii]